jgi:hypothetical protein
MGLAATSPASRTEGMRKQSIVVNTQNAALAVRGGGAHRGEVWRLAAEGKGARERTVRGAAFRPWPLSGYNQVPLVTNSFSGRTPKDVRPRRAGRFSVPLKSPRDDADNLAVVDDGKMAEASIAHLRQRRGDGNRIRGHHLRQFCHLCAFALSKSPYRIAAGEDADQAVLTIYDQN